MDGFTCNRSTDCCRFEHPKLHLRMDVFRDGSGQLRHGTLGNIVDIPTVEEINLGGFANPQRFDNIRHDIVHIWYCYHRDGALSPNHQKLMEISDTPLWQCHWEEYKVESLELYMRTGEKREALDCYEKAQAFFEWVMASLCF